MGELTLASWASQGRRPQAHKSDPDETGWDFILELPSELDMPGHITLPLDMVSPAIQCLVQVKSTDSSLRESSEAGANWARLVKSPLPAFFLILDFRGKDCCQRAYLVHVGEVNIRQVLRRLRELSPGDRPKLHEKTLRVTYSENDELSSLDGNGLLQAIRRYADDLPSYTAWKQAVLRDVGYENGKWAMSLIAPPPPGGASVSGIPYRLCPWAGPQNRSHTC